MTTQISTNHVRTALEGLFSVKKGIELISPNTNRNSDLEIYGTLQASCTELELANRRLSMAANPSNPHKLSRAEHYCRSMQEISTVCTRLCQVANDLMQLNGKFAENLQGQLKNTTKTSLQIMEDSLRTGIISIQEDNGRKVEQGKQLSVECSERRGKYLKTIASLTAPGSKMESVLQMDLSTILGVSPSAVSTLRKTLVETGLVEISAGTEVHDERMLPSKLTKLGWQALALHELKTAHSLVYATLKAMGAL